MLNEIHDNLICVHTKSGGLYEIISASAKIEATLKEVVVYRSVENGMVWVRPVDEFRERFGLPTGLPSIGDLSKLGITVERR